MRPVTRADAQRLNRYWADHIEGLRRVCSAIPEAKDRPWTGIGDFAITVGDDVVGFVMINKRRMTTRISRRGALRSATRPSAPTRVGWATRTAA